ncbi:MAG: MFS transporter [Microbacteriaceae bacterium]|nr:MFS transporter [Microbacteriaceae bacterium]
MKGFSALLKVPGVLRIVLSQLYARLPGGMLSLGLIIYVERITESYAIAGITVGAATLGISVAQPALSRWMAVFGIRMVLGLTSFLNVVIVISMAFVPSEPAWLVFLGLMIGLTQPPIQTAARTIYPQMTPKKLLGRLFSLDATAQEIIWVVGPVVITLIAAQFGSLPILITIATIQATGSIWFIWNKEVGQTKIPRTTDAYGKVLKNRVVSIMTFMGLLFIGSFAGLEVGSVAMFDEAIAGLLIAVFSVGSVLGGVFIGGRANSKYSLSLLIGLVLVGFSMVLIAPDNAYWVGLSLFIAGIGVAPTLGIMALTISGGTKPNEIAEAYGWQTTGQLVGISIGSALAGIAVDIIGPVAAFAVSVFFGIGTLMAALLAIRYLPTPSDITSPETGPIAVVEQSGSETDNNDLNNPRE